MLQVEDKLRDVLSCIVEERFPRAAGVRIKPMNSDGNNYTSVLFEVTIITPEENMELFAKVATVGGNLQISHIFDVERFVYTELSSAYEALQNKHGLADGILVSPQYYRSTETDGLEIIILENLVAKGYKCRDRLDNIDWKFASKSVETLARFHALSLAFSKQYPEEFKKAGEALKLPEQTSGSEWNGLMDGALAAVDETDREIISKLFEGSIGWSKFLELQDPFNTSVITHGDYKPSNLMYKEKNVELHVIPVDFQMMRLGCPVADLVYFIVLGSDQQFRQQHFHQLVDHYYQQLALAMKKLGLEPKEEYGREEFDSDLKKKLPIGLCVAAMALPFITLQAAHAPSFEEGTFVPRANELFAERFRGLVQDFKQWGFI